MKKLLSVAAVVVLVWSCAKKITPAASTPASNGGSTVSNTPASLPSATGSTTNPATGTGTPGTVTAPASASGSLSTTGGTPSPQRLGQQTFNAKCGRCHGLKVTTDYTVERWISIMQVMAIKANLDETEKSNVLAYVTANAKR